MHEHDPAFQWETAALRRSAERRAAATRPAADPGWVTLRQAHRATGIPVETLRKWARKGAVPSAVTETEYGTRRMIDLESVILRAAELGRDLDPPPLQDAGAHSPPPRPSRTDPVPPPPSEPAPESHPAQPASPSVSPAAEPAGSGPEAAAAPPGTMIVPIDAWDKMLMQLGNLHEAGQQLAEARERAAKAETEARFLRERLAELRVASVDRGARTAPPAEGIAAAVERIPVRPETPPVPGEETKARDTPFRGEQWARSFTAYASRRWQERRRR